MFSVSQFALPMKRAPSAPVPAAVRALLRRWRAQRPLRAGSLLITIFGDAIAPRGAAVTLGSLIRLAAAFAPVESALRAGAALPAGTAFVVRTLLIHEYRKIHLQDPLLPPPLLPRGWVGSAAYELCRRLYARVFAPAESYLSATARRLHRPLPSANSAAYARFRGLVRTEPRSARSTTRLAAPKRRIRLGILKGKIKLAEDF